MTLVPRTLIVSHFFVSIPSVLDFLVEPPANPPRSVPQDSFVKDTPGLSMEPASPFSQPGLALAVTPIVLSVMFVLVPTAEMFANA